MGTREECEQAQRFYDRLCKSDNVLYSSVSGLYPNRGSNNQYRVYIEIVCKSEKMDIYSDLSESELLIHEPSLRLPLTFTAERDIEEKLFEMYQNDFPCEEYSLECEKRDCCECSSYREEFEEHRDEYIQWLKVKGVIV